MVDDEGSNKKGKGGKAMATVIRVVGNKEGKGNRMALTIRVVCDKEGNGVGSRSNGNEGGRQTTAMRAMATAMATVTTWAMVKATRLVGNKDGKAGGGKGNGDSNECGKDKKGEGSKAMETALRMAGEQTSTVTKRAMVTTMREGGNKEGSGKGNKSNGDGEEGGNSKEDGNGISSAFDFQFLLFGCGQTKVP